MPQSLYKYFSGPKGLAYTVFLFVGLVGICIAISLILSLPSGQLVPPIYSLGASISTTILVVGLVEILTKIIEISREGRDLPLFKEFFGADACRALGVEVVFLSATLPPVDGSGITLPKGIGHIILTDPPEDSRPEGVQTLPKGIGHIIPAEDLNAALEIDREFKKYGAQLQVKIDEYKTKELPKQGCIAIGLGYNNITLRLMHKYPSLYKVKYNSPGNERSDDFVLPGESEKDDEKGSTADGGDYALIARVLLGSVRNPVPYIVIAGHTAGATVVACHYLADNWRELANLYRRSSRRLSECSMAVILQYKSGPPERQEPRLDRPRFVIISSQ